MRVFTVAEHSSFNLSPNRQGFKNKRSEKRRAGRKETLETSEFLLFYLNQSDLGPQ